MCSSKSTKSFDKGTPDWSVGSSTDTVLQFFICNDYFSMIENLRKNSKNSKKNQVKVKFVPYPCLI